MTTLLCSFHWNGREHYLGASSTELKVKTTSYIKIVIIIVIVIGICFGIFSTKWLFIHCFQIKLEFKSVGFCEGSKTGEPREKPSEQSREPTTNSTHI